MTTADVNPPGPPEERRCASHALITEFSPLLELALKHNSPVRMSNDENWPPAILFDGIYAGAVVHHFGTQALGDKVIEKWKTVYYPDGNMTVAERAYKAILGREAKYKRMTRMQSKMCEELREVREGPDLLDMVMGMPFALVPQIEIDAVMREAKEAAAAAERKEVEKKMAGWLSGLQPLEPVRQPII